MDDMTLKHYFTIYTEAWKFFREHQDTTTQEEIEQAIADAEHLQENVPDPFLTSLLSVTLAELDRLAAERHYGK